MNPLSGSSGSPPSSGAGKSGRRAPVISVTSSQRAAHGQPQGRCGRSRTWIVVEGRPCSNAFVYGDAVRRHTTEFCRFPRCRFFIIAPACPWLVKWRVIANDLVVDHASLAKLLPGQSGNFSIPASHEPRAVPVLFRSGDSLVEAALAAVHPNLARLAAARFHCQLAVVSARGDIEVDPGLVRNVYATNFPCRKMYRAESLGADSKQAGGFPVPLSRRPTVHIRAVTLAPKSGKHVEFQPIDRIDQLSKSDVGEPQVFNESFSSRSCRPDSGL